MSVFRAAGGGAPIDGLSLGALFMAALLSAVPLRPATAEDAGAASGVAAQDTAAQTPDSPQPEATEAKMVQQPETATDAPASPQSGSTGAETPPSNGAAPGANAPASASVVINLIRLLVQEGVLTQAKADALIRQAQDEATAAARAQAAAAGPGIAVPVGGESAATATTAAPAGGAPAAGESPGGAPAGDASGSAQAAAPQEGAEPSGALPKAQPPSVHVQYVPEIVKKQITEQVRKEVMEQAKAEHWAEPNALPEWTKRIKLSGDFRLRQEWNLFDRRNVPGFTNFNAINTGSPFDVNLAHILAGAFPPTFDTTDDRERMRIRARLGLTADITDDFTAGMRLATGNFNNPVSTNQTLGSTLANQNFLLDRAFIEYRPAPWLTLLGGRFANPWFSTDLVWDPDINFDGVAAQYTPHPNGPVNPFLTLGLFPIENTPFNFPDNSVFKQSSRDKWLYGAQAGLRVQPKPAYSFQAGLALYDYTNINGVTSSPCGPATASQPCDTDNSRPGFMQQGNTVFRLRNLSLITDPGASLFQYFGLASNFRELNATLQFDYAKYDPLHLVFDADFVTNLAFDKKVIAAKNPENNLGPDNAFAGGANGYQARLTFGHPQLDERWDWNVYAAYKWLESDAVLDAFTDSDFHLGGTNAKGYIFGGGLSVAHNIDLSARWLSASEVTGPPYSVDVIQVDLNGRF